jgi:hypothetical protein
MLQDIKAAIYCVDPRNKLIGKGLTGSFNARIPGDADSALIVCDQSNRLIGTFVNDVVEVPTQAPAPQKASKPTKAPKPKRISKFKKAPKVRKPAKISSETPVVGSMRRLLLDPLSNLVKSLESTLQAEKKEDANAEKDISNRA